MNARNEWISQISEVDKLFGINSINPYVFLKSHIQKELNIQNNIINNSSIELKESITSATSNISGTLENGFNFMAEINADGFKTLAYILEDVQNEMRVGFDNVIKSIDTINLTLNLGFAKLTELNRQRNIFLEDIVGLLHIPDIEKERKMNIEKGLDFLKKSAVDISILDDAKKHFENALKFERTDFYVNYNLGIIHFFYNKLLDIDKAIDYFLNAGKYANAEMIINKKSITTINKSSFKNSINPKIIATYSYLYASRCYHLKNENEDALKAIQKSYSINSDNLEIAYDYAKYNLLNKNNRIALKILEQIIKKDRFITLKILVDKHLISNALVTDLLSKMTKETIDKAKIKYDNLVKYFSINEIPILDEYHDKFDKVGALIRRNTFLEVSYALDILNEDFFSKIQHKLYKLIKRYLDKCSKEIINDSKSQDKLLQIKHEFLNNTNNDIEIFEKIQNLYDIQYEFPTPSHPFIISKVIKRNILNHIILEKELFIINQKINTLRITNERLISNINSINDQIRNNKSLISNLFSFFVKKKKNDELKKELNKLFLKIELNKKIVNSLIITANEV